MMFGELPSRPEAFDQSTNKNAYYLVVTNGKL